MGLDGKMVSATLLATLLIGVLASAFTIQPVKAESATISGTILYNGQPVSDFTSRPADFWARDEIANAEFPISPSYDSSTGKYSIPNMPPGKFGIRAFFDVAPPFDTGIGFAGDFYGFESPVVVPEGEPVVYKNLSVQMTLHLTSPVDNAAEIGTLGDPKDTYPPGEMIFRWDALAEASGYHATLQEYAEPFTYLRLVTFMQNSNLEWSVLLPISEENHFYVFDLWAYGTNLSVIGTLKVSYYNGFGPSYLFRISPLLGDLNNDGAVDIFDVVILALAFGSKPGDPNWNPDADLNNDGVVDIFDVVILVNEFGG